MHQSRQVGAANSIGNECPGVFRSVDAGGEDLPQATARETNVRSSLDWPTDCPTVPTVPPVGVNLVYKASTFRIQKLNGAT